jgi:PadR family transcriptional regulator PadR
MNDLSLSEEMVLWAVWKLEGNAYGVTIRKQLFDRIHRHFAYGTLYGTLAKLTRKGYVSKTTGDPSPVRGGRSRNYYAVTSQGLEALKAALELKKSIWDNDSEFSLLKS